MKRKPKVRKLQAIEFGTGRVLTWEVREEAPEGFRPRC